jgi:hypothetical protein
VSAPYIKGVLGTETGIFIAKPSYANSSAISLDKFRERRVTNDLGYHIHGYKPSHPKLLENLRSLSEIGLLELDGCQSYARLRHCEGCHDLFTDAFGLITWTYLIKLKLSRLYMYVY